LAVLDHGYINTWQFGATADAAVSENFVNTYILPYLKFAKNCGSSTTSDCLYTIYNLNGQPFNWSTSAENFSRFYLVNGTAVTVYSSLKQMQLYVDINGWKAPNKLGVDIFAFMYQNSKGPKNRQKLSIPNMNSPQEYIKGGAIDYTSYGCSKSAATYAGLLCTGLIFYSNGGKIPTKKQYIDWGGKPEEYPWNF